MWWQGLLGVFLVTGLGILIGKATCSGIVVYMLNDLSVWEVLISLWLGVLGASWDSIVVFGWVVGVLIKDVVVSTEKCEHVSCELEYLRAAKGTLKLIESYGCINEGMVVVFTRDKIGINKLRVVFRVWCLNKKKIKTH